jgi:hypothetical protein
MNQTTKASGGLGVAGGTIALGAIAAGPALLIAGWYMSSKAEKNLISAKSNIEIAEKFEQDIALAITLTDGIKSIAIAAIEILSRLRMNLRKNLNKLNEIIVTKENNYQTYDNKSKSVVMRTVKLVQLIKAVINTPILDEQGNLLRDADINLSNIFKCLSNNLEGDVELVSSCEIIEV